MSSLPPTKNSADNRVAASAKSWEVVIGDRKSTRLNSSHQIISYAVFCLKKKIKIYAGNRKSKEQRGQNASVHRNLLRRISIECRLSYSINILTACFY